MESPSSTSSSGRNDVEFNFDFPYLEGPLTGGPEFSSYSPIERNNTNSSRMESTERYDTAMTEVKRTFNTIVACRKAMEIIDMIVVTGERYNTVVSRKVRSKPERSPEHNAYREYVKDCGETLSYLGQNVWMLNILADSLEKDAAAVHKMANSSMDVSLAASNEDERNLLVCWARLTRERTRKANKILLFIRRCMWKYYSKLTDLPTMIAPQADPWYVPNTERGSKDLRTTYGLSLILLVGFVLQTSLIFDFMSESVSTILITGTVLVGFYIIFLFYKLYIFWKSERIQKSRMEEGDAEMSKTNLENRLRDLEIFLTDYNIEPFSFPYIGYVSMDENEYDVPELPMQPETKIPPLFNMYEVFQLILPHVFLSFFIF